MKSFKEFNEAEEVGAISGLVFKSKTAGVCNRCGEHKDPILKVDYHKPGKTCFDCYKKDSPDAIIHYGKDGAAKRFEGSTASSITPGKECYMCGESFKKGDEKVKFRGEYEIHKKCEHGVK